MGCSMAQRRGASSFFLVCVLVAALAAPRVCARAVVPTRMGKRYIVGGPDGWTTPPPGSKDMYAKWAAGIRFFVDDSIEFVYTNDSVIKVDKFGYYHCNVTAAPSGDGSALFLLNKPGLVYFSCADVKHCKLGQRLMINVEAAPSSAPSTAPAIPAPGSSIAITPATGAPSSSPGPAPEEASSTSAASPPSSSLAHGMLLAFSATAVAMMSSILRE
ncbi:hypothetical protein GUJ93_ZPchr0012g21630 [Zizania palustris]|uniref:Phytocyanin domain-containing protein n=1 Tax=Zizania palustris TaxID=103762 RepID=A0A8J6BYL7_ZIZPA|nr:hypothetical protein GUJ93_ZPchr0012g21630 [Zizania palustris]